MFSSKDLLSFVFANENDTYYGDDFLKRDLNQYLWERLHENYEAVYFLSAEDGSFRVRSYGDLNCHEYTPKKKKMFGLLSGYSEQSGLGTWIHHQLCAKPGATAAFVCSLDDFCSVLSDPEWSTVLEGIADEKKRTGIFVLTASATAEKSANLLLTSPVFEKLRDTTITDLRDGALRDLYNTIKRRKGDNCVFLNNFTWEQIHGLLLHLLIEHPDRFESCEQLDIMSDYLYTYLREPDFDRKKPLFSDEPGIGYMMYEEMYTWLRNDRNWQRFENKVAVFAESEGRRIPSEKISTDVAVLRDPNSYAGKCLKIRLPDWLRNNPEAENQAQDTLHHIFAEAAVPKSKIENPKIVVCAEKLLNQLDTVAIGDTESFNLILNTLKFCVDNVYAPFNEEKTDRILSLLQKKQDAIGVFDHNFKLQNNISYIQTSFTEGAFRSAKLKQLKENLYATEQIKKRYMDLISAMELDLERSTSSEPISTVLETLKAELEAIEKNFEAVPDNIPIPDITEEKPLTHITEPEPESQPQPETKPEPKKEEYDMDLEWELRPEDRGYIPIM